MSLVLQDQLVLSPATADHLQEEIDAIEAASDVADVVGNYEELEDYDTSALTDKDVIKVLDDETHDHAQTYWRYSKSGDSFTYIGQIAKPAVDSVNNKTGNVVLDANDVGAVAKTSTASQVYGTDANGAQTTYNKDDFGQVDDVQVNGVSVVTNKIANVTVPDPLPSQTGQSGKFLTTDGTDASWSDKPLVNKATGANSLAIGENSSSTNSRSVAIGTNASTTTVRNGVAIGPNASVSAAGAIQLGSTQSSVTTNSDTNTFKVANSNGNFEMMSADGTIPEARLADTASATEGQVLQLDSNNNAIWADVDGLPDQTSQAGKILGTDGTNAAWETKTTVSFRTWGVNE